MSGKRSRGGGLNGRGREKFGPRESPPSKAGLVERYRALTHRDPGGGEEGRTRRCFQAMVLQGKVRRGKKLGNLYHL